MNRDKLRTPLTITSLVVLLTLMRTSAAFSQKATEVFIPIGQSPGLSATHTTIGIVDSISLHGEIMMVSDSGRTYVVRFTRETKVYLDRTYSGGPNKIGKLTDCKRGLKVEVKYVGNKIGETAEWLKLEQKE